MTNQKSRPGPELTAKIRNLLELSDAGFTEGVVLVANYIRYFHAYRSMQNADLRLRKARKRLQDKVDVLEFRVMMDQSNDLYSKFKEK